MVGRCIFLGTPEFALPALDALVAGPYDVAAIFTQPDRAAGRGRHLQPPPVKVRGEKLGIRVYQPARIRSDENRPVIASLEPDFLVVVAYGQILPPWLLEIPRIAPVNIHASLLPRHRGAAPVAWTLLNGEAVTGITTMLVEATLDTGPILLQREVAVPLDMRRGELEEILAAEGARLLHPTLDGLRDGSLAGKPQDPAMATLAPKLDKDMAALSWERSALEIHNRVRAFHPSPLAHTRFRERRLLVLRTMPAAAPAAGGPNENEEVGSLLAMTEKGIVIACGGGSALELLEVQFAGKRPISGREFANGARLKTGEAVFPSFSGR